MASRAAIPGAARGSARERILETATRLFLRDGYRATGIDRIIAESGVAKMSLYRHFASKTDLIAAFLDARHREWMEWFAGEVERRLSGRATLAILADALASWFGHDSYRGCAFINIVAETGAEEDDRLHQQAAAHKTVLFNYVADVAARLGHPHPRQSAEEAMLCIEGMIVRYQMTGDPKVLASGRRLLARIG